ncbi:MAG: hypothetical protein JWR61_2158 [Ferruginibacter sp.]|nr:hypothetical protein [Ferruginibacter sp.]
MLEKLEENFVIKFTMLLFIMVKLSCTLPFLMYEKAKGDL